MTKRALFLGMLGAVLMGVYGQYAGKYVPGIWGLVRGYMPVTVYGAVILAVVAINPLVGKIRKSWRLKPGEIAVIFAMTLVACGIADGGLMRNFPRMLIHPVFSNQAEPGWQEAEALSYTPPSLLVNDGQYDEKIVGDYVAPAGSPGEPISLSDVPWHAWWKPLSIWTPLILLSMLGSICLAVIVHRQWANRERLRYPLADMASVLMRQDERGKVAILQNRLFWGGFLTVMLIQVMNGVGVWTESGFGIPLSFDFSALRSAFPEFMRTPGASNLAYPKLYPACIGVAFLMATDISFSLGIANFVSVVLLYFMISFGMDMGGNQNWGGVSEWTSFGSFLALGVMLVYIGRRYYWNTLREAVTFKAQPETERGGVWACRGLILCTVGSVVILSAVGLDPLVAVLAVLLLMLAFVVCARMNAECGVFYYIPSWAMPGVLVGLYGMTALGPATIAIIGLTWYMLIWVGFECMMPFAVTGLKVGADTGLKVGKLGLVLAVAIVLVLALAIPTALWSDYNHAPPMKRGGTGGEVYDNVTQVVGKLSLANELETVKAYGTWDRLKNMRPSGSFMMAAATGFALLLLFSALRMRFNWWPLHPVILLWLSASVYVGRFSVSFLVGCIVKTIVVRFGGRKQHDATKNLMIGIVIGDLAGGFVMMLVSWIYYAVTGEPGQKFMLW